MRKTLGMIEEFLVPSPNSPSDFQLCLQFAIRTASDGEAVLPNRPIADDGGGQQREDRQQAEVVRGAGALSDSLFLS
jgi:hypothetical protein